MQFANGTQIIGTLGKGFRVAAESVSTVISEMKGTN